MKKFGILEEQKEWLVQRMNGIAEENLQRPPAAGKWSAAQVIDHVASAESRSLEYIRKKTQTPESVPPAGFMCALRTTALVVALSSPFKFKAPDVVSDVPDNPPTPETLERWERTRCELKSLIETFPEELLMRALFKHPVAGRMNMSQTLDFMTAHLKRHSKQLVRSLE